MIERLRVSGLAVGLCLAPTLASASAGVGTTGAQFLKIGVGARALAMGGAYSAVAGDSSAMFWNPGALGSVKNRDLTMSYNMLFQDESQGYLGYVHPAAGLGVFGAGLDYLAISNIEKRAGDTAAPDSTFTNQNFALNASYGTTVGADEGLSIGANVKYIREALDAFSGNAVALDFGALAKTGVAGLRLGGSLQNLGTKIGPDPLPTLAKGGGAYQLLDGRLTAASDLEYWLNDQRFYWDLGAEARLNDVLAFRAGYQWGHNNDHLGSGMIGMSFGIGLKVERFRVDYAFLPFGDLGDTHRVTLGWSF